VQLLRALSHRVQKDVYRDANVEVPLPAGENSLAQLANPDAVRRRLADDEETLKRWEAILHAIQEREKLTAKLQRNRVEETKLRDRIFGWEQLQIAKTGLARLKAELKQTDSALETAAGRIRELEKEIEITRETKEKADKSKVAEENQFNAVMGRFKGCLFPEFDVKPLAPEDSVPGDFDAAVALFLRRQDQLQKLDQMVRENYQAIEVALGSDYAGADETETVRLLREELEALPEQEDA